MLMLVGVITTIYILILIKTKKRPSIQENSYLLVSAMKRKAEGVTSNKSENLAFTALSDFLCTFYSSVAISVLNFPSHAVEKILKKLDKDNEEIKMRKVVGAVGVNQGTMGTMNRLVD